MKEKTIKKANEDRALSQTRDRDTAKYTCREAIRCAETVVRFEHFETHSEGGEE